jgi:hypothetical protein
MEEGFEKSNDVVKNDHEAVYSKALRAGKRTYFFDVKATNRSDYYLTITESKKRFGRDGRYFYEKHKMFLYKEDMQDFAEHLAEMVEYIKSANGLNGSAFPEHDSLSIEEEFADVHVESLLDKA